MRRVPTSQEPPIDDRPPWLTGCYAVAERIPAKREFPFDLPFFGPDFELKFRSPIVVIAGENGSGKSTLLESLAALCGLSPWGGGRAEKGIAGERSGAELARAMRPIFRKRPRDAFFLRAETLFSFAGTLEDRDADPEFVDDQGLPADPYVAYGGKSLHRRSHGEAFLAVMRHRLTGGLYMFDEPESALSPRRQLEFARMMMRRVRGDFAEDDRADITDPRYRAPVQIVMASHSPLLMTIPGAELFLVDGATVRRAIPEETPQWAVLRDVLSDPGRFWRAAGAQGP